MTTKPPRGYGFGQRRYIENSVESYFVLGFASQISVSTEPSAHNVIGPLDIRQWLVMRL